MYRKLFQITVTLVLAIISIAFLAFLLTGITSVFQSPIAAGAYGISIGVGGLSERRFRFLVLAAVLLIAGCYFLWSRRKRD